MIPENIQALRQNINNYKWKGSIYCCPEDPYIVVPKKIPWMGWTMNFGHPKAAPVFLYILFASTAPILFIIFLAYENNWPTYSVYIFLIIQIIFLALWAHREATKCP